MSAPAPREGDPLATIPGALGAGALLGVAALSLVVWLVQGAVPRPPAGEPAAPQELSGPFFGLVAGSLAAVGAAGGLSWYTMTSVRDPWRRTMLAVIGGLGSFVLATILTIPAHSLLGRRGLLLLAALAGAGALLLTRRLSRAAA